MNFGKSVEERLKVLNQMHNGNHPNVSSHNLKISETENKDYKVFEISIDLLKYRIKNTRTIFNQKAYIENEDLSKDFFEGDHESVDLQKAQHTILQKTYNEKGLYEAFKKGQKQSQPLIVTLDGFVIAGNRRLAAFRDLYEENSANYSHFKEVRIVIFEHMVDSESVKDFEALQEEEKDIKSNFSWISVAMGFANDLKEYEDDDIETGKEKGMKALIKRHRNSKYLTYERPKDMEKEIEGWIYAAKVANKLFDAGRINEEEITGQEQIFKDMGIEYYKSKDEMDITQKKILRKYNEAIITADVTKIGKRKYEVRKQLKKNLNRLIKDGIKEQNIDMTKSDMTQRDDLLKKFENISDENIAKGVLNSLTTVKQEDDFNKQKNALKDLLQKIISGLETAKIKSAESFTHFDEFDKMIEKIRQQLGEIVKVKNEAQKTNK